MDIVAIDRSGEGSDQGYWKPVVGEETFSVLDMLPEATRKKVGDSSSAILGKCVPPSRSGSATGLVIGYIQSGKTLSFTTVSALAHDNGYKLVIVIAGSSEILLSQTNKRLHKDLSAGGLHAKWSIYSSSEGKNQSGLHSEISAILDEWTDPVVLPSERRTVLITVMKNVHHLTWLQNKILAKCNLGAVPTIIIDDEADQASLNIQVRKGEESSTYRKILDIRAQLPSHTYIQYTATPQALLLINIIDSLSPDFVEILEPGSEYTGGKKYFEDYLQELITVIPESDISSSTKPLKAPPASLIYAIQLFLVGVAVGMFVRDRNGPENRSMMVHPDRTKKEHARYVQWIKHILEGFKVVLTLEDGDRDRIALEKEFKSAYDDLGKTSDDLPSFEKLLPRIPMTIGRCAVREINTRRGQTPNIDWKKGYAWILVGGQSLDRGYTVEGLTVTYMPRGLGVGNADTVQQRARWFGYKAGYIGLCRVFLSGQVIEGYKSYVRHEEDVRRSLSSHQKQGGDLKEWPRVFRLSPLYRPTRAAVISANSYRGNYANTWFAPRSPHLGDHAVENNRFVFQRFLSKLHVNPETLSDDNWGHRWFKEVSLQVVYSDLLSGLKYPAPTDCGKYEGLLLQLREYLASHPEESATIIHVRPTTSTSRATDENGEVLRQLFQGRSPYAGNVYPGDKAIKDSSGLTVQLHQVDIYKGLKAQRKILISSTPIVAVWVPKSMSLDWYSQDE